MLRQPAVKSGVVRIMIIGALTVAWIVTIRTLAPLRA